MDIAKMLYDTADQHNHARWQGSLYALQDLAKYIESVVKEAQDKETNSTKYLKIIQHILAECKRYDELMLTTDMGKKMKDLENIK